MALIRPEARRAFLRWREVVVGCAAVALGLYWGFGFGILVYVGWGLVLVGAALVFTGVQRAVFRQDGAGEGVVRLVEGQVGYFGPRTGGVISVGDIRRISRSGELWIIESGDGTRLEIPSNAEGAEVLIDVFMLLPGLDLSAVVQSARRRTSHPQLLWKRPDKRLH